jgi:hypothetical protein
MNRILPSEQSQDLRALCAELVPDGSAMRLPRMAPLEARPVDCFETVEAQIVERGGSACHGWSLWERRGLFLEAEFYSVWRDIQGELHDITPRLGAGPVLFLPDPDKVFDGRRIPSVRRPLLRDPAVMGFLRACDEEFALIYRGARAFMREVSLQGAELCELQLIWQRKMAFSQRLSLLDTAEA